MIEIVALMIGDIVQCYSEEQYDNPQPITQNMFLRKGQPKSLYRPGSSTTVLLFQRGRIQFAKDLLRNLRRLGVSSRFSQGLECSLVETEVKARSALASPHQPAACAGLKQLYTHLATVMPQRFIARFS